MTDWWTYSEEINTSGVVSLSCGSNSTAQYLKRQMNSYLKSNNYNWRVTVKTDTRTGKYSLRRDEKAKVS